MPKFLCQRTPQEPGIPNPHGQPEVWTSEDWAKRQTVFRKPGLDALFPNLTITATKKHGTCLERVSVCICTHQGWPLRSSGERWIAAVGPDDGTLHENGTHLVPVHLHPWALPPRAVVKLYKHLQWRQTVGKYGYYGDLSHVPKQPHHKTQVPLHQHQTWKILLLPHISAVLLILLKQLL